MTALLKYGTGMPFYRLERLPDSFGIPLPASTRFELVAEAVPRLLPVLRELIRQGAQGELFHNDDTYARILERLEELRRAEEMEEERDQTGTFTSAIVAHVAGRRIALFFTGANPFDDLTTLLRHTEQVAAEPGRWLPWNYEERLAPAPPDG